MKVSKYWRGKKERDKLTGTECNACGERFIAPQLICPTCHHKIAQLAQHIFPTLPLQPVSVKKAKTLVSVIILSYNSAETIRATLSSILEQDLDEPYKIIVIDNSDDRTPDIITQEFPQVCLIHNTERIDPGTARNLGITLARGEIIAFLDADCIAPPDWLSRMVAAQHAGHLIVGGSVENGNPEKTLAWASYLNKFQEFIPGGEPRLVYHAPTCNISYHRSIFSRFGGFPTTFYPQEGLLLHWWLSQQGIGLWFDPSIQVKHTSQTAWRPYLRQQRRSGLVTAQVLELTDEKGAFLARSSLLALLTMPLLPIIKFLRTVAYFINYQPGVIQKHWAALPALLLGLYAWGSGFVAGAWAAPLHVPAQGALADLSVE
jgi:glycosyltransferase involved in cell wall biosynthesis